MSVRQVGVVVPVHDEERLLPDCLDALAAAVARVSLPVVVAVVLDRCRDGSARLATDRRGLDIVCLPADLGSVGPARAHGAAVLLGRIGVAGTWLANTDADSRVPAGWLARQLDHAAAGADVVAGTVVPDAGLDPVTRARAEADYARGGRFGGGHGHVHGANLGLRAETYLRAGGFPALRVHEDVGLVRAALAAGARVTWADDLVVVTSARRRGRVRGPGFAHHLTTLADGPAGRGVRPADGLGSPAA